MTTTCTLPGCSSAVAGRWSIYCRAHRARKARHGDPRQEGIQLPQLRPYLRLVDQARKRNPESPLWPLLVTGWGSMVERAEALQTAADSGLPFHRYSLLTAQQVIAISRAATPEKVVDHGLAMSWLWANEPQAFASDDAFRAQMARRIRLLAPRLSKGTYWSGTLKRVSTVVQELPPKVALPLGQQLVELFGPAGLRLAELERNRVTPEEAKARALRAALTGLQ